MEEIPVVPDMDHGVSVLPVRCPGHHPAQDMGEVLHAITYSQYGQAQIENFPVRQGCILIIDISRPAREDNPLWREIFNLPDTGIIGMYLAIDLCLTHPAGYKLGVLGSEVQYQDLIFIYTLGHYSIL